MSWIRRYPLAALAALALALRVACAAVTELNPIFPAYYYTDAVMIHSYAASALEDVRAGRRPVINGSLGERVQTSISLGIYRAFGPRPFLVKLLNALMGALAVTAFAWALSLVFPGPAALSAGLLMAIWPSHIFYTSQNLKEAPIALLAYAALVAAFAGGFTANAGLRRTAALALTAASCLLAAGFLRSYVLICLGAALLGGLVLSAARPPRANALLTAAALLAALALYAPASRELLDFYHSAPLAGADLGRITPRLFPVTFDNNDPQKIYHPTSPEGLSGFRSARQSADRNWARIRSNREIGTQIYPNETFETWLDVAAYLPKGAFTVLFMPLPGLYPLDGKVGRWAAAGENTALVLIALLGAVGLLRGPKTPARLALLAFFAAMTGGAALLEFDLGSAGRHKLLYLSMLFPFAAEETLRRIRPGTSA